MTLTSKILPKSSGSLATILSRAIFAKARHEFDIYPKRIVRTASFPRTDQCSVNGVRDQECFTLKSTSLQSGDTTLREAATLSKTEGMMVVQKIEGKGKAK